MSPGKQFTIGQAASFIGKLVSAFPGIEFGRFIIVCCLLIKMKTCGSVQGILPSSLLEVQWWADNIDTAVKQFTHSTPEALHTGVGCGATIGGGVATAGNGSQFASLKHINVLSC